MVLYVPNKMAVFVCDLYIADMLCYCPVCNDELPAFGTSSPLDADIQTIACSRAA